MGLECGSNGLNRGNLVVVHINFVHLLQYRHVYETAIYFVFIQYVHNIGVGGERDWKHCTVLSRVNVGYPCFVLMR